MLPGYLADLVQDFARLEGIGEKTARRLVLKLLQKEDNFIKEFGQHLQALPTSVKKCFQCQNYTEGEAKCKVCSDSNRDNSQILVLASPLEIEPFSMTSFNGYYFILHNLLDPLKGEGPEVINTQALIDLAQQSLHENDTLEVILALPTSLEGEATSRYLQQYLQKELPADSGVLISILGKGLPANSAVEYHDSSTLSDSLSNRMQLS